MGNWEAWNIKVKLNIDMNTVELMFYIPNLNIKLIKFLYKIFWQMNKDIHSNLNLKY